MLEKGVLLINLGTPDDCQPGSVRRYLREFLNDPRVIDLPAVLRWPLVNLAIIPFRYKKTTAAYQKIWPAGNDSPLRVYSEELKQKLAQELGPDYQVEYGMRYGRPSIAAALDRLRNCASLTVVPLFPQYTSAATGSALEQMMQYISRKWNIPEIRIVRDFYAHPGFVSAYAELVRQHTSDRKIDMVLFSYHGLPERHLDKSECRAVCDRSNACPAVSNDNLYCYRAQCYSSTYHIAQASGLSPGQYAVSFQSRLGRTPWIKPYTDLLLPELVKKGVKNIAVVCPSFTADCLETLEEVDIRTREQWKQLGGNDFTFIPCLNASPAWVKGLAGMIADD